ncbi:epidermal growth factor receptor kinase substrate 8-like protein 3 [Heteronotia binoei]|uniref:epidermal growth factor receptor kinase substrate 8-like protein 3 n=1 Tax=Heteronotia binoei TaxID=13085 RepID=UPI002931CA60|nr:epidermal growth factor receptor kinase substrate 8-like protein 3 [Heteronotia binoei]
MDGKDICNVDNCIGRLKLMNAQGQVWGQDMFLQVKDQKLLLTDIEAEVELESYPLECIQECICVLDSCIYNSILAITMKEMKLHRTSIMLFQCEEIEAQLMKTKLEKAIEEWKGERQSQDLLRNSLENMLHQRSQARLNDNPQNKRAALLMESDHASVSITPGQRRQQHPWEVSSVPPGYKREVEPAQQQDEFAWEDSGFQTTQDTDRVTEILNHILSDIEIFVEKLQDANKPLNDKKKKKKSKKNQETLPPEPEFKDCFQKIKYSFNLLAMVEHKLQQPSAQDLVHLIFSALSTILSNCPWPELAPMVDSPLLIPAAINLLKHSLNSDEQATWKSLGHAWGLSRSEYLNGESIPPYNPVFSDGWVPPSSTQRQESLDLSKAHSRRQTTFSDRAPYSPQLMKAIIEFHARNPRELTVMKGDLLEVLDQQKKWWLARNTAGETGYIPNNILEPMDQKALKGNSMEQAPKSIPDLQPTSTPAEVTAWLKLKGFSNMTVKSLGVLNGKQLLSMSQKDLSTVCPEEGKRVFFMLSAVKLTLEVKLKKSVP